VTQPLLHRAKIDTSPQAPSCERCPELVQPKVVFVEFGTFGLLPCDVRQVRQFVVRVVTVLVSDLVARRALPEEGIGDQAVYSAFLLEAVAGKSDEDPPVLQFNGMEDIVGLCVADLPQIRDLVDAVISGDIAPFFAHTSLLLESGEPEKVYPSESV